MLPMSRTSIKNYVYVRSNHKDIVSYLKDKLSERSLGLKLNLNNVSLKGFLSQLKESRAKFVQYNKKFRQLN